MLLDDVGYVVDSVDLRYRGEKLVVCLAILTLAKMEVRETRNKGLYDSAKFSHGDLILFFRYQLRVKIVCDRKRFDCITFGEALESSFSPFPAHGNDSPGPSGPHPR